MAEVRVMTGAGAEVLSCSPEGEQRVISLVQASLQAAGGSWRATVTPSAALSRFWVVQIARVGSRAVQQSVIFDERTSEPDAQLLQVIAEMTDASRAPDSQATARAGRTPAHRARGEGSR